MNGYRMGAIICIIVLLSSIVQSVSACKDIIACGAATNGEYNLLLKVRDPSRPGYQVLTMVPEGYAYQYPHPWTGRPLSFQVNHSMIGVATINDTIPNIVKAGMCLTAAGLCFGDADTITHWKNPSRFAWDDFDWIRYAAQTANDEDEAIELLTKKAIDQLHAPGVPENLFVLGPKKGAVIEADVIHYNIREITDEVAVMSNYAKALWDTSILLRLIAPSFNATFQGEVSKNQVIRLGKGCLYGIKVIDIDSDSIEVKQIPVQFSIGNIIGRVFDLFSTTTVNLSENETVGFYRIGLDQISDDSARVRMCYEYKAWEDHMMEYITPTIGSMSVSTMMNLSRLHSEDLDGLRGMCDDHQIYPYEGCMIYKIPSEQYHLLSEGWFSPNHPCSSIYVPVHICNTDIYDPYESGEAAMLSLELLELYGHDTLSEPFHHIEQVFITELEEIRPYLISLIDDPVNLSSVLTSVDVNMQRQAYMTQQLWLNISKDGNLELMPLFSHLYEKDLNQTFHQIQKSVSLLNHPKYLPYKEKIILLSSLIVDLNNMCIRGKPY